MPLVKIYFGILDIQYIWKRNADKKKELKIHQYDATAIDLASNY